MALLQVAMRQRFLEARKGLLLLGSLQYTPLIEVQAKRDGIELTDKDRKAIRQYLNCKVTHPNDMERAAGYLELLNRTIESQSPQQ